MDEQTTPETEVSNGLTEDQAVQEMLGRWGKKTEQTEAEETPQEEETQQAQATAGETESQEESAEDDGEIEIDVAGEKFKIPKAVAETAQKIQAKAKEVEAGATRKFQEAADLRKATEAEAQAVTQLRRLAEANADLLADHRMVVKRLEALQNIDINNTDVETLSRLNAEFNQLSLAKQRIEGALRDSHQNMTVEEGKALQARQELANKQLAAEIKDWSPEYAKKLAEYAKSRGAPEQALAGIYDAWVIRILDDAAYGRAMREAKPQVEKRVAEAQKTLKPNGATKSNAQIKADIAVSRAKKTGSMDDAVTALLARAQQKRR